MWCLKFGHRQSGLKNRDCGLWDYGFWVCWWSKLGAACGFWVVHLNGFVFWSLYVIYCWVVNLWVWCYFSGFDVHLSGFIVWYLGLFILFNEFHVNLWDWCKFMGLMFISFSGFKYPFLCLFARVQYHRTLRKQWWTLIIRFYTSHKAVLNCLWVLIVSTFC